MFTEIVLTLILILLYASPYICAEWKEIRRKQREREKLRKWIQGG